MPHPNLASESLPEVLPLNLKSVRELEFRLRATRSELRMIASRIDEYYKPFQSRPKQRPFAKKLNTKTRRIDNPLPRLKQIQRAICSFVSSRTGLPAHIFGGVKGRGILDN